MCVVQSFLFLRERLPRRLWDPGSSSHRAGGLGRRRGQGRRRWAVPGAAQGRQADKAPPAPSPTAAFQKGGEGGPGVWGWRGKHRRERGEEEGAVGGTGLERTEEGGQGGGAKESREEGRILEAQDKQIVPLHVRGGGWERASSEASPPPHRLFVTARPPERPATLAPPLALRDPERARRNRKHSERAAGPGLRAAGEGTVGRASALRGEGYYRGPGT